MRKHPSISIGYEHLLQAYGMTETQGIAVSTTVNDSREIQPTTCGRAQPGFDLKLVGPESGEEVIGGGSGEAWLKGRTHLTYFGMPPEQLEQFYSDDGYYRTGDVINRCLDGRYEFVTRIKDLIKVVGEDECLPADTQPYLSKLETLLTQTPSKAMLAM